MTCAFPAFYPSASPNVTFLVLFSACYTAFTHTFDECVMNTHTHTNVYVIL